MFAPLPEDRFKDASCFEVTGIDLAGPVFLRDGSKSWIVLFTCSVNWDQVVTDGAVSRIIWKFIPPSSPWWGGWWERLIALVKDLFKRVLGKASLKYEELNPLLCECESIINSRPITYVSDDNELEHLTPSMFMRDLMEWGVPDLDNLESTSLQKIHMYRLKLREDLRKRFRLEYLGHLRQNTNKIRKADGNKVGEIVLIENKNLKRLYWHL
ncbi:uncharacterized protein LOC129959745 [Argiope bruennichi]|uniref:uncharacterized protein LOC129959741 n=1 Tax=Argiope bruennichi TaxID=94029 RepID=UPI002494C5E5|nr:uncharacterized protein LOC129959741 [Argiope bruennichi]XP_055928612.1 uncharacterized protein LOC129959745 [Argiope bruennichi]